MPHDAAPQPSPQLLAEWLDRARLLGEALADHPEAPGRWLWATRLEILRFLLHRYGRASDLASIAAGARPTPREAIDLESDARPPMASPGPEAAEGASSGLRHGSTLRAVLARLSTANRERYARAVVEGEAENRATREALELARAMFRPRDEAPHAKPKVKRAPRPAGFVCLPPMPERLLAEEREIVRFTVRELANVRTDETPLSEDEIVAILAGDG